MGGNQSATRSSVFDRSDEGKVDNEDISDDNEQQQHIRVSNKMVERLVEDATLSKVQPKDTSRDIPKASIMEKVYSEKLQLYDEQHTKKMGLTYENVHALTLRVNRRAKNVGTSGPVCENCRQDVMNCYITNQNKGDNAECGKKIDKFKECVRSTAFKRVDARIQKDAKNKAQRTRKVARARDYVLRDLANSKIEEFGDTS